MLLNDRQLKIRAISMYDRTTKDSDIEIDLLDIMRTLWAKRAFILKTVGVGIIAGTVIAFSIPKEYTTPIVIVAEAGTSPGNMGALAAIAGVNLKSGGSSEIIPPELYPDILNSTPFMQGLLDVPVKDVTRNIDTSLKEYLTTELRSTWWSKITGFPASILAKMRDEDAGQTADSEDGKFNRLSKEQNKAINILRERIGIQVDDKTGMATISTTMQSPDISAQVGDTITSYLQAYVINYRTEKSRQDLEFYERLYEEAKQDYADKQRIYASYSDQNQNIVQASYRINLEKLQNEASLSFSVYNQMAQHLQSAKMQLQDRTPVYKIIQPAVMPTAPSKPNKKLILAGFAVMSGFAACCWVIFRYFINDTRQTR